MKYRKFFGCLLIITGVMVISGIILNNHTYWSIVDIIVITSSCGTGLYLLRQKEQVRQSSELE
jgi:hypothetical protein